METRPDDCPCTHEALDDVVLEDVLDLLAALEHPDADKDGVVLEGVVVDGRFPSLNVDGEETKTRQAVGGDGVGDGPQEVVGIDRVGVEGRQEVDDLARHDDLDPSGFAFVLVEEDVPEATSLYLDDEVQLDDSRWLLSS
jgi:hypothetical protein